MRYWRKFDNIGKREFEKGIDLIIENVAEQTCIPPETVAQYTHQIIDEFGVEYKKVPDDMKGYEAIISMIYLKYMQKLDMLQHDNG